MVNTHGELMATAMPHPCNVPYGVGMKAEVVTFLKEGFVAGRGIKFENGLLLRAPSVLWLTQDEGREAERQFNEVLEAISTHQVTVSNVP